MEKSQVVDRTPEKVKLAQELGLHSWAAIHGMINMKFKPITHEQISIKLGEGKRHWRLKMVDLNLFELWFLAVIGSGFTTIFSCGLSSVITGQLNNYHPQLHDVLIGVSVGLIGVVFAFLRSGMCRVRIEGKHLNLWTDNMPYGALLAVKEAKEAGLTNFYIHYPVLVGERVMADPVIVGQLGNSMYEVFFWDDGTIYE